MEENVTPKEIRGYEAIESRFEEAAITNFRGSLDLLISSGSFAYRGATKGKSDLDVMAIFGNEASELRVNC